MITGVVVSMREGISSGKPVVADLNDTLDMEHTLAGIYFIVETTVGGKSSLDGKIQWARSFLDAKLYLKGSRPLIRFEDIRKSIIAFLV